VRPSERASSVERMVERRARRMWSAAEGVSCAGGGVVWVSGSLSAALLAWACGRVGARHTAHTRHRTRERNIRMKMSSKLKLYTLTVL
jgi:hypothetical protein